MRISSIGSYNYYNNSRPELNRYEHKALKNDTVSFSSNLHLKELNPAYRFCMSLFKRSILASRRRLSPTIEGLEGKLNEVSIPLKGNKKIIAYDINPNKTEKYIVFFHGSSLNISNCQQTYKEVLDANFAVLAPEFSGFGKNNPMKVNEFTIEDDVEGILKYLKTKNIKPENTGIIGHSLGSFATILAAEKMPDLKFMVIIAPVNTIQYEINNIINNKKFKIPLYLKKLIKICPAILNPLGKIFKTEDRLSKSNIPLHIIHSANDKLIPVQSSIELSQKAKNLKELRIPQTGGHGLEKNKLDELRKILDNY